MKSVIVRYNWAIIFCFSMVFSIKIFGEDCLLISKYNKSKFIYVTNDLMATKDQGLKLDSSFGSIVPLLEYFVLPEEVKIDIETDNIRQNGYADSNLILFGTKEHEITDFVDPILAHEFGHLIFGNQKNLSKLFTPEEFLKINQKIRLAPYDEFFADLVAVLATKDGAAMYTALKNESKERDFTSNGVGTTKDEIKKEKFYHKDDHHYFFQARQLIWKKFEKDGKSKESAQNILRQTYLAIGKSIKNRLEKFPDQYRGKSLTPDEIEYIEQDLVDELNKK